MADETSAPERLVAHDHAEEKQDLDQSAHDHLDQETQHMPHDLVFKILLFLDAKQLLRFACVCKAWHDTITGDRCFQREHHRLQDACMLIAPRLRQRGHSSDAPLHTSIAGLYRLEMKIQQEDGVATLHRWHTLAHCHGLVLVPTDSGPVCVFNPATRRVLTLPPSSHGVAPPVPTMPLHQAFGFARFFYRSTSSYGSRVLNPAGQAGSNLRSLHALKCTYTWRRLGR
jgi:hypothetical protein